MITQISFGKNSNSEKATTALEGDHAEPVREISNSAKATTNALT